jgi:hypothetical protein
MTLVRDLPPPVGHFAFIHGTRTGTQARDPRSDVRASERPAGPTIGLKNTITAKAMSSSIFSAAVPTLTSLLKINAEKV